MNQLTVYVVDDSKDAADSLAMLLEALDLRAVPCYSGEQLLTLVEQETPHCVMLDIAMEGMDGLQLTETLRKRFGDDIVLVAITGSPGDDPTVRATFKAVDHYFEKPATLNQILKLFPR